MNPRTIKGILFDLDGVLYVGDQAIEGAIETLNWVKDQGLECRFITNTTTKSVDEVAEKLQRLGFEIPEDSIFSAITATRDYLRQQGKPCVDLLVRNRVMDDFAEFPQDWEVPDYVVVGAIGAAWDYSLMNRVFNELMNGATLLAMHKTKYWQTDQGLCMDIGGFVAGFEYVSGQTAVITGKPSQPFFEMALKSMGLESEEVVMIGDDIENDVGGAQQSGIGGILVRTGKFRESVLEQSGVKPDHVMDSIAALPDWIESGKGSIA